MKYVVGYSQSSRCHILQFWFHACENAFIKDWSAAHLTRYWANQLYRPPEWCNGERESERGNLASNAVIQDCRKMMKTVSSHTDAQTHTDTHICYGSLETLTWAHTHILIHTDVWRALTRLTTFTHHSLCLTHTSVVGWKTKCTQLCPGQDLRLKSHSPPSLSFIITFCTSWLPLKE